MRRIAMSLAVIVLVLGASRLLAQTSGPASQKEERTFFSTTFVSDARIESAATVSSASPASALALAGPTIAAMAAAGTNLAPYQPSGWSNKIVVSKDAGTNLDSSPLAATDTLYVDFAVLNNGTVATAARSYTELYVDGVLRDTWYTDPSLNSNFYSYVEDYSIGSLAAGTHTIRIKADSTNAIAESDETDNEYTKTITVGGEGTSCVANATTLCLNAGRFQVRVSFQTSTIPSGTGTAISFTGDTGYFWFFSSNNVELVIKVLDGYPFNNFFWVFYGALSNVAYTITITDMDTGAVKVYSNPQDTLASVADTAAFPRGLSCSYTVSAASPASFGSGGGSGTVSVTTQSGCAWTATSSSSFITITGGSSGSGNGTVSFSVASNGSTSSRTGTMTIAGQTVTITQSGLSSGGIYDGTWSGTTSQTCDTSPCTVSWTIANTAITGFSVGYDAHACGAIRGGTSITYDTPRPITGGSFTVTDTGGFRINFSVGGTGPVDGHWTVNGTFNSSSSASGSGSVTLPVCSSTVPITFSATKN